eukprot:TRINITY_DN2907_c0_g1_i2.p1 TRINITY_DN2907_c0_g1~~TRINITY_DN2907_c0_g1_i2.p1  ORF type:complete len:121 (+),score=53.09 TRINITY_DN2907_c0_g1_i2:272-634(+)
MCGRAYSPNFLFMWPNAKISVMGGEQAAGVLAMVEKEKLRRTGKAWTEEEEAEFRGRIQAEYDREATAFFSSARLWDDGIIDPADTRTVVALCLSASAASPPHAAAMAARSSGGYGVFRM